MTWGYVAVAAATVVGSAVSANAAKQAAKSQGHAADVANQTQRDQYNQTREDQAPWRNAGGWAIGQLQNGMGPGGALSHQFGMEDYQADPGFAFRLQQGEQALGRSAAARGGALGGGTLKALTRYNSDQASQEYNNAFNRFNSNQANQYNRLASMAGMGQTSANMTGQFGMNAANNIAANQIGVGNANAASGMAQAQGWGNAINGLGSAWYQYANRPQTSYPGGFGSTGVNGYGATNNMYGYGGV